MFLVDDQRPTLVTAPATGVVALEEMKGHVRVIHDDDDADLQRYLDAAVSHLDGPSGVLGRCLITQTWQVKARAWPLRGTRFALPVPDCSAVTISYRDTTGAAQSWASSLWHLVEGRSESAVEIAARQSWPALDEHPSAVTVTFTAGYGATEDDVPQSIRHAILLLAATWFENREAYSVGQTVSAPLPFAVNALLAPHRRVGI